MTNTITIDTPADQGQVGTTSFSAPVVSSTITFTNPCKTTTISGITFDTTPLSVFDGYTVASNFAIPGDQVDTDNLLTGLCGNKVYLVQTYDSNTNTLAAISGGWAVVRDSTTVAGKKELFIDTKLYPTHIAADIDHTIRITTTFETWTTNPGTPSDIPVTLKTTSCNCAAMIWQAPALQTVTVNVGATTSFTTT